MYYIPIFYPTKNVNIYFHPRVNAFTISIPRFIVYSLLTFKNAYIIFVPAYTRKNRINKINLIILYLHRMRIANQISKRVPTAKNIVRKM